MSLLNKRIGTLLLLALFVTSSFMAVSPISETIESEYLAQNNDFGSTLAGSVVNLSIPYVDDYYGITDGIIDPTEYAYTYTDSVTGVNFYAEHDGTTMYVGLEAITSGWIGFAWQNYTDTFRSAGLNNSDVIVGYSPGSLLGDYWRVLPTDFVTVHYILSLRNGTAIQEADYPDDTSVEPIGNVPALQVYKDAIIGMRIGETRHFTIPADQAYTQPDHTLYGQDLIYDIELTRISRAAEERFDNPADQSQIVYSDEYGTNTFQHLPDANQSRILHADGSDNGMYTQLEFAILLNSTDTDDIPLLISSDIQYPFIFMFGTGEELNGLPVKHTYWAEPALVNVEPNAPPTLVIENPQDDAVLDWVVNLQLNATDDWVTDASYRIDQEDWNFLEFDLNSGFWEAPVDLSPFDDGAHVITFNATDISNATAVASVNVVIDRPYAPLLGMKVDVARLIIPTANFGSRVDDTYTVVNNGSAPISSIDVYLPDEYASNFLSMSAADLDNNEVHLNRLEDNGGMLHWRLHFDEPIGFQEQYSFKTTMQMTSLFWLSNPHDWEYKLNFLKYPYLPYIIRDAEFALGFEQGGSMVPGEQIPDSTDKNLAPFTMVDFTVDLFLTNVHVVADRTTKVTVNAWGWLSYRETVTIINTGANALHATDFNIPAYSTSITIFDEVGVLAYSQNNILHREFNETSTITINLDADRFGNGLESGFSYTFTIYYVIQTSSYQEVVENGNQLDIPMADLSDVLVREHIIDVILTSSVSLIEATDGYRMFYGIFDTTLRYTSYNTTWENPISLEIVYTTTLGAVARPVIFSLMFGFIGLIYVVLRKVELPEEVTGPREDDDIIDSQPKQVGAPAELLREFANLYSKKTALNMDIEKLEAARRRGKVKKREYMIRERDMKQQVEEIDDKLPSLRADMISYGARYRDLVGQLELQDERIEGAKAGLRQLLLRKKKQRISRVAFEKSRQDYLKTIQKATSASDRILLSLQEEAGDI
ncbi:MAG: FKBP-type peptidyl-prolyl cis-trans isomerase [Candidatus Thorarchaeota archaeon]